MNKKKTPFVIAIGEAMIELSLQSQSPDVAGLSVAGDTLNTAIYLKRCLPDARVAYATKLGADEHSARVLRAMEAEGLDTSLVLRSPDKLPGLYAISTDPNGERSFTYWRDNSAARELMQPPGLTSQMLAEADLVYLSAISLAILPAADRDALMQMLAEYRAHGGRVAFDSNYRPRLWPDSEAARATISRAWGTCDIGLPSLDDEQDLFDGQDETSVLERLRIAGVRSGALKRGASGPIDLDGNALRNAAKADKVLDTTSAGDSFNGAYLAAYLSGAGSEARMQAGHQLAARVIGVHGAIIPVEAMP